MTLNINASNLPTGAEEILEDLDVLNQQGDIEWDKFKFEHFEALFASLKRTQGFTRLLERLTDEPMQVNRRIADGIIVADGNAQNNRIDDWYPIFQLGESNVYLVINSVLAPQDAIAGFANSDSTKACLTNIGIGWHDDRIIERDDEPNLRLKTHAVQPLFQLVGNGLGSVETNKILWRTKEASIQSISTSSGSSTVVLKFDDDHEYLVNEEIDVKIKKFEVDGRKSTDLDGNFTITTTPNSKELSFDATSISGSNLDYTNAIAHVSYPVEQEELTRLAVSMELTRADNQPMEGDNGFPRFNRLDFDASFGEKNDGWKIELAARQFQRKIDDLPSDLSLDVDSDRPLSDLASGIIETLLQMAGVGRVATHLMPMLGLLPSHLAEESDVNWPRLNLVDFIYNMDNGPALWGVVRQWLIGLANGEVAKIWMQHALLLVHPYGEPKKKTWRAYSYCNLTDLNAVTTGLDPVPAFENHHCPEELNDAPHSGGTMRLNNSDFEKATKIWVRDFDSVNEPSTVPDWDADENGEFGYLAIRSLATDSHDVIYFKVTGKGNITGGHYLEIEYDEGKVELNNGDYAYTSLIRKKAPDLDRRIRGEGTKEDPLRTRLFGSYIDDEKTDDELHNEWGLDLITSFWEDDQDNIYLQAGFSFGMENTLGEFDEMLFESNLDAWIVRFKIPRTQPPSPNSPNPPQQTPAKTKVTWFPKFDLLTTAQKRRWPQPESWMEYRYYDAANPNISLPDESNKAMGSLDGILLLDNTTLKDATRLWMNKVDLDGLIARDEEEKKILERSAIDSNGDGNQTLGFIEVRTKEIDGTGTVSFPILSISQDNNLAPANQGGPGYGNTEVVSIELDSSMGDFTPSNGDSVIVRFHREPPNSLIETPEPAKLVDEYLKDEFNDPDNPLRNTRVKIERARFGVTWDQTGDSESGPPDIVLYDSGESRLKKGNLNATSGEILWDDGKMWKPTGGITPVVNGSSGLLGTWEEWHGDPLASSGTTFTISSNTNEDKFHYDAVSSTGNTFLLRVIYVPKKWKPVIDLLKVDIGDIHKEKIDLATPDGWLDLADSVLDALRDTISDALASRQAGTPIGQWVGSLFGLVAPRNYPFRKCDYVYGEGVEYDVNDIVFYNDGGTERVYQVITAGTSPETPFGHTAIRPTHDSGYDEIGTDGLVMRYLGLNDPIWETNDDNDLRLDLLDIIKKMIESPPESEEGIWWLQPIKEYYHRLATTNIDPYDTNEPNPALLYIVEALNFTLKQLFADAANMEPPEMPIAQDISVTGSGTKYSPYRMSIGENRSRAGDEFISEVPWGRKGDDTEEKGLPWFNIFLIVNQDTGSGDSRFELGIGCTAFLLQLWDVFCLDFGIDVGLLSMDFNQETYTNDDDEEIEYIETGTSLLTGAEVYAKVHDPFSDPGKQMTLFDIPGMQFTIDGFSISGYWRRPRSQLLKAWIEDSIVARDSIECPDCGAGISEPCFEQASQTHSSRDLGAGEDCTECSAKGSEPCRESLPEIHEARMEAYCQSKKFGYRFSIHAPRLGSIVPDYPDMVNQLTNPIRIGELHWDGDYLYNADGDAVRPDLDDFLGASDDPPMESIEISPRDGEDELPIPVNVNWDYFGAACEEIGYDSNIESNKGIYGLISNSAEENGFFDITPGSEFYENESVQMLVGWCLAFKGGQLGFALSTFFRIHPHLIHLDLMSMVTNQGVAFELPQQPNYLWPKSWTAHHQKGRAQFGLGLGPLSLPYDWPRIEWNDLVEQPLETIKDFIITTLSEVSASGEPFAFGTFRWLSAALNGTIPSLPLDDATLGWPTRTDTITNQATGVTTDRVTVLVPEVPMEVTGDGTFANPWAVRLTSDQEKSGRILFWLGPDGPRHDSMLEGVMSSSNPLLFEELQKSSVFDNELSDFTSQERIEAVAEILVRLSYHSERIRSALGDTSKQRLISDLSQLDAFLKISDGVSELDSQLSVDNPTNIDPVPEDYEPELTAAAYSLKDENVLQEVGTFVSSNMPTNWEPGDLGNDVLLLVSSDSDTGKWDEIVKMLLENYGSLPYAILHHPNAHPLTYLGPEPNTGPASGNPKCKRCELKGTVAGIPSPLTMQITGYICSLCEHSINTDGDCLSGPNCDTCNNSLQDLHDEIYKITSPYSKWDDIKSEYVNANPQTDPPKTIVIVEIGEDTTALDGAVTSLSNANCSLSIICHGDAGLAIQDYVANWDENKVKGVLTINAPYHGIGPYNSTHDERSILRAMSFIHRSKMGERLGPATRAKKAELDEEYDKGDTIYYVDSGKRHIFEVTCKGEMDVDFSTVFSTVTEDTPIGAKFLRLTHLEDIDNETYLKTLNLHQLAEIVRYAHEPFKKFVSMTGGDTF